MNAFSERGDAIRSAAKALVLDYLMHHTDARPQAKGVKQATIFQDCGFDWGAFEKATSSNQQYWIVALLNDLQKAGLVEQVRDRGPWRRTR